MSGSGRETLRKVKVWWEVLTDSWEWSGGPLECPKVVGGPHGGPGSLPDVGVPCQMLGRGLETLPNVREWWEVLTDSREWSGGPLGCTGVVWRPSRMPESGRVALPDVREWLEIPPGCSEVVGRPFQISGSGQVAFPDAREWSCCTPGCPGEVRKPSWMSGRQSRMPGCVRKPLPDVRKALPDVREWSGDPSKCPGGVGVPPGCP